MALQGSLFFLGLKAMHDTRDLVGKNSGRTAEQKLLQLDNFVRKHLDKITRTGALGKTNCQEVRGWQGR